jgi:hypothetical protein
MFAMVHSKLHGFVVSNIHNSLTVNVEYKVVFLKP